MIIPIKCFTCGKVLADKYIYWQKEIKKYKIKNNIDQDETIYLNELNKNKKTIEGKLLDKLGLNKMCCRRHMLTHVDIE